MQTQTPLFESREYNHVHKVVEDTKTRVACERTASHPLWTLTYRLAEGMRQRPTCKSRGPRRRGRQRHRAKPEKEIVEQTRAATKKNGK